MSKIIIGIHGLGNKPPKRVLKKWWKKAIREGFDNIERPRKFFKFKLVYWAHYLHPEPLDPAITDKKDPLYVEYPYLPGDNERRKKPSRLRRKILDYLEKQMDKIFLNDDYTINFSAISDMIIHRYFKDLEIYFSSAPYDATKPDVLVKDVIRNELIRILRKYRRKEILLIGHSMGSIIAYDVLNSTNTRVKVNTFVTIGSPLGLPVVISKIVPGKSVVPGQETEVRAPENVYNKWYNLSDLEDRVAIDYNLAGDYAPNSHNVMVEDSIVVNDYEREGNKNPHKSYGYLRTPELAEVLDAFLDHGRSKFHIRILKFINRLFSFKLPKIQIKIDRKK
ncbi:MAG: hypothetical protein V2J62_05095 [candidate division KSB1 bacterium]|jgi:hypothetical protein|nr:hypothetical protein [candidate division KSB1 bacterium]